MTRTLKRADRVFLARQLARPRNVWQEDLLDASKFASICCDMGLRCSSQDLLQLWAAGLLRADLVHCATRSRMRGLVRVHVLPDGTALCADLRRTRPRPRGWLNVLRRAPVAGGRNPAPFFHPFRCLVLAHLWRQFEAGFHPLQFLIDARGARRILDVHRERIRVITSGKDFLEGLERLSAIVDTAVAIEPFALPNMRGSMRLSADSLEAHQRMLRAYWRAAKHRLVHLGVKSLEGMHREVCIQSELVDHNRSHWTVIRLMSDSHRQRLRGSLACAVLLRSMAEVLRRGAESAFATMLPEEDEVGFGHYFPGTKERLYGAERLLDGNSAVVEQFLRAHGLDYGVRVRWYVEGETEFGALSTALERVHSINLVNLRGAVVEKGGKSVAFRDSLRADMHTRTFSMVSVDADRQDVVRVVEQADLQGEICGKVFLQRPDFEFANFTLEELQEALLRMARKAGVPAVDRRKIRSLTGGANCARALWADIRRKLGKSAGFGKGVEWGRTLIELAYERPMAPSSIASPDGRRPVIAAIDVALGSMLSDYELTRSKQAEERSAATSARR